MGLEWHGSQRLELFGETIIHGAADNEMDAAAKDASTPEVIWT
ncbi:MAG: hypothetical protein R2778_04270 [Saprospiraceae bacterium]